MIKFTATTAGQSALNSATEGSNPVLIDSIVLYNESTSIKTITEFSGSVVADDSGIGDYVVIDFDDNSSSAYTITQIRLKSGETELATSENVSVVKEANKKLKLRITAQFDDAEKCSFITTHINLPYATTFRDGVVRFAAATGETQKSSTVYSASVVESVIDSKISGSPKYVPWNTTAGTPDTGSVNISSLNIVNDYNSPTQTVEIAVTGSAVSGVSSISVDGYVTGTAVASSPTITSGAITDTSKLVNGSYIAALYSNAVDTNDTETDAAKKLVTSHAVRAYVETKLSQIDGNYVHLVGNETINGVKTFSDGVVASSYTGDGVYSTYDAASWDNSANNAKLPTLGTIRSAINAGDASVTSAFQLADQNLQSQIDGINAGQNLADIVDLRSDLATLDASNLNANDKVQLLHDKSNPDGTIDTSSEGISTVYTLLSGTPTSGTRDIAAYNKSGFYWHYVGEYGVDAYTKSETSSLFVAKASLDQTIESTSSTTNAPSTKAVYDHVDSAISDLSSVFVKLTSATSQTIASPLVIKQSTASTNTLSIPDGQHITTNNTLTILADGSSKDVSTEYDTTNGAFTVKLDNVSALDLRKTAGTSTSIPDASGDFVASYRDVSGGTLSDGRLVTVDYLNSFTGDMSAYAKVAASNTFAAGYTNTFNGGVILNGSVTGTSIYSSYSDSSWADTTNNSKLPTLGTVRSAIDDAKDDVLDALSTADAIGSIGLFIYSEVGAEKAYGQTVSGTYLKPVGISLPMSGQISYKSVAPAMTGTWKLLSVAVKRTATEPCLVLAQKISN